MDNQLWLPGFDPGALAQPAALTAMVARPDGREDGGDPIPRRGRWRPGWLPDVLELARTDRAISTPAGRKWLPQVELWVTPGRCGFDGRRTNSEWIAHAHNMEGGPAESLAGICLTRRKRRGCGCEYYGPEHPGASVLHEVAHIAAWNHGHTKRWRQAFAGLLEAYGYPVERPNDARVMRYYTGYYHNLTCPDQEQ